MKNTELDVKWYAPNKKKCICQSTKATADLIIYLSKEHRTIQDVRNAVLWDNDAKIVLDTYIDLGYGDIVAKEWFK